MHAGCAPFTLLCYVTSYASSVSLVCCRPDCWSHLNLWFHLLHSTHHGTRALASPLLAESPLDLLFVTHRIHALWCECAPPDVTVRLVAANCCAIPCADASSAGDAGWQNRAQGTLCRHLCDHCRSALTCRYYANLLLAISIIWSHPVIFC